MRLRVESAMLSDILHALMALAAFLVPMLFAWFALSRTARRHRHPTRRRRRSVR
jgi:hypothetical protein